MLFVARTGTAVVIACAAAGCGTTVIRSGPIIDAYARAACIPEAGGTPFGSWGRWDDTVTLRSGERVRVLGMQGVPGRIDVEYDDGKTRMTVASGGEKSNPIDVRFDAANDRLYVKFGRAILEGTGYEYLHEFDLVHRRSVASPRVDWAAFPAQCPDPSQS